MSVEPFLRGEKSVLRKTEAHGPAAFAGVFAFEAVDETDGRRECEAIFFVGRQIALSLGRLRNFRVLHKARPSASGGLDCFLLRYSFETGAAAPCAGALDCYDLSQDFYIEAPPADTVAAVSLWLPRSRALRAFANESALHGYSIDQRRVEAAVAGAALHTLGLHVSDMNAAQFDAVANGVVGLIASSIDPLLAARSQAPLDSFVTIRRYIDQNIALAGLDANHVANAFGVSRASLYRLLEPLGGVGAYIRHARLNRAYQEITSTEFANRRIGQIAFKYGFKNASAFNTLFRKRYGVTPGEARKLGFATSTLRPGAKAPPVSGDIEKLLAALGR
jgi:AraC-like DNA-binding protein